MLSENNEVQSGNHSVKTEEKDFPQNVNQLARQDGEGHKTRNEPVRMLKQDKRPSGSQTEGRPGDTVVNQTEQALICVEMDHETEQCSQESRRPSEKASEAEMEVKLSDVPGKNREDEKQPVKPLIGKETVDDARHMEKTGGVDKTEKEPFRPTARSKGRSAGEQRPLKHVNKESEEMISQLKPPEDNFEDGYKQKEHVKQVSKEADREKTQTDDVASINDLGKQSVGQEVTFVLPKPPVRTKSKTKGGGEKTLSRGTETDQDEQELTSVVVKTGTGLPIKQTLKPVETEADGKSPSVSDKEIEERVKQVGKAREKDVNKPITPLKKEPDGVMKLAAEAEKRNEKQQAATVTQDVLLLSGGETFSEALTEMQVKHTRIHPGDASAQGSSQDSVLAQTSNNASPDTEITTDNQPQMQEAAVKIQAAFKGYKARKDMRPVFKEVFKNQNADLHGTVALVCVVEGKASSVRWLKNGQHITNDQRCRAVTAEDGVCSLVIKNLTTNDSGTYTCEVVNKFGVTSYNGNLTVVQPAPGAQKPVHPPLAAITRLQPATPKLDSQVESQAQMAQTQIPAQVKDAANYVESVSLSLWEAYTLTEQGTPVSLERRCSSLIAASSSEYTLP